MARAYIAQLAPRMSMPADRDRLEHAPGFFPAEGYHQNFIARNPDYPYIVINDRPKVEALKRSSRKATRADAAIRIRAAETPAPRASFLRRLPDRV